MQEPQVLTGAPPGAYVYGTVCRVNFWVKMTTALGISQIVIGASCIVFYTVAFFTDVSADHIIRYLTMGIVTGIVISVAGILGMLTCKKKTKCTVTSFLVMSILSAVFALFPMVLGIVGATSSVLGEESLLMPICQLVFSTVEIVVASWSIGVCCQSICCPNATFGHVTTRLPTGLGITQFISSGDGQHVVLFTSSPTSPSTLLCNMNGTHHHPYFIQQGVPTLRVATQPGITCAVGQNGIVSPPNYYESPEGAPPHKGNATPASEMNKLTGAPPNSTNTADEDERDAEAQGLLNGAECESADSKNEKEKLKVEVTNNTVEGTYEVEDEEAHLLR